MEYNSTQASLNRIGNNDVSQWMYKILRISKYNAKKNKNIKVMKIMKNTKIHHDIQNSIKILLEETPYKNFPDIISP